MDETLVQAPSRVMPNSPEAELSVIGSMLIDNEKITLVQEILTRDDFYNNVYGCYFEAITELYNEDKPIDPVVLQDRLLEKKLSPESASIQFINGIIDSVPVTVNAKDYANIVREKALLRL